MTVRLHPSSAFGPELARRVHVDGREERSSPWGEQRRAEPGGRPAGRPAPGRPGIETYLQMTIDELTDDLGGQLDADVIVREAERAARDLRGSISPEALPEMVGRLVRVRLSCRHLDAGSGTPSVS